MLGPFATTSRLTTINQMLLAVLSRAACASMSTTTMTTTTTTRDTRGPLWPHLMGPIKANIHGQHKDTIIQNKHKNEATFGSYVTASKLTVSCTSDGDYLVLLINLMNKRSM